jgi:hypothetical protein
VWKWENGITIDRQRNFIKKEEKKGNFKKPQQNYVGTRMKI